MNTKSRNRAAKVGVWSALAGGAVGFALGMAFAPKRGPDTRRRLAYQMERFAVQAGAFFRRFADSSIESDARRTRDAMVADAQERADTIRDDIDSLLKELREQQGASSGG